jgi:glutamyl-tRNA synthetase
MFRNLVLLPQRRPLSTSSSSPTPVRVRYAPSPTGFLHLGGLRTALYNYAYARARGGTFILRIEDTDKSRQVPGSAEGLVEALKWCGLTYDEGPGAGGAKGPMTGGNSQQSNDGPHAPYVQSQRLPLYKRHAEALLHSGHAYRCFCTVERLAMLREERSKKGQDTLYDRACARIKPDESERRAASGESHVIRMRVPDSGATVLEDAVLGPVKFAHAQVDEQVLLKSDGFPTYHLASVVDDAAMKISHVIRGQEWLSSTPKHLLLYAALGLTPPTFAHLPLLLNQDRSKLSKRAGDAAVEDFRVSSFN